MWLGQPSVSSVSTGIYNGVCGVVPLSLILILSVWRVSTLKDHDDPKKPLPATFRVGHFVRVIPGNPTSYQDIGDFDEMETPDDFCLPLVEPSL